MKLPDLWIAHPAADGGPVSFRRWAWWKWSEFLDDLIYRIRRRQRRAERRALYPDEDPDDDIPF